MEVRSLMVTLRRSLTGRPHFHKRILDALGLRTRHQCVERPNNESIRGMLEKVSHLVIVETDRMFYLKRMRDYYQQCMREPIAVSHGAAVEAANARQSQITTASPSLTSPRTLPASVRASLPLELQQQPLPPLHPAQSVLLAPHMHEHMQPLPRKGQRVEPSDDQGASPSAAAAQLPSIASVLDKLLKKRSRLLQGRPEMLYNEQVLSLNKEIMEAREKQYQQEVALRLHAIKVRQILGNRRLPTMPGKGKGGRRGLLDGTRAALNQAASGTSKGGEASRLGHKQQGLSSTTS